MQTDRDGSDRQKQTRNREARISRAWAHYLRRRKSESSTVLHRALRTSQKTQCCQLHFSDDIDEDTITRTIKLHDWGIHTSSWHIGVVVDRVSDIALKGTNILQPAFLINPR